MVKFWNEAASRPFFAPSSPFNIIKRVSGDVCFTSKVTEPHHFLHPLLPSSPILDVLHPGFTTASPRLHPIFTPILPLLSQLYKPAFSFGEVVQWLFVVMATFARLTCLSFFSLCQPVSAALSQFCDALGKTPTQALDIEIAIHFLATPLESR